MYRKNIDEIYEELSSNKLGLSKEESKSRLEKNGPNKLQEKKKEPIWKKILEQFTDILIIILLVAAVVSIIVDPHEWVESLIIFIVVCLNAFLGVFQEVKAEKSLDALKKMSSPHATVLRNGNREVVKTDEVVVGDIIYLEAGDLVPADARIIESFNLKCDESSLTGESVPSEKNNDVIDGEKGVGDRKNMVFSSTVVTYGSGLAIVTATGMDTEVGHIAQLLMADKKELTPLQKQIENIGKVLGIISIVICIVVFALEWLSSGDVLGAFKGAVALAVAAVPEGLAAFITVILAFGMQKLVKVNAIVKKLPSVETLGCASVVCSDKTGTLTKNEMTVMKIYKDEIKDVKDTLTEEEKKMLAYFSLSSDGEVREEDGHYKHIGDPTETALVLANMLYGVDLTNNYKRVNSLPFDSERKLMSVIYEVDDKLLMITKGAPDVIVSRCKDLKNSDEVLKVNEILGSEALRVLGVAYKEVSSKDVTLEDENVLHFIGLVGMIDPPREEVKLSIEQAKGAGIRTVMITGDHKITASAIAKELGILRDGDKVISGAELKAMSQEELFDHIEEYSVYARVNPEDKVRIVEAWQNKGKIVAMTGDGVNDSPALKRADIGCAMGITGTEVAKQSASLILTDDNFGTIIHAVKEGRGIYDNIKKVVQFLLSSNIGEVLTIFLALVIDLVFKVNLGIPLLAIHLLFVNLITDTLPAFALGLEPVEDSVMKKKPREKHEKFFSNGMGSRILVQGILVGGLTLASFLIGELVFGRGMSEEIQAQIGHTMAFITLSVTQFFHAFNVKSDESILNKKLFNNKWIWIALGAGLVLEAVIIYVPFFANLFQLYRLSVGELFTALGLSFSIVILMEIYKLIKKLFKKN